MKLLFLGASNTDCGHCFSEDNLGYGYVKVVHDLLLQKAQKDYPSEMSLSTSDSSVQIKADHSGTPGNLPKGICTSTVIINGGTDGFTFPRILRKWEQSWKRTAFDAVFILGGINEVGALMDSGMDETHTGCCCSVLQLHFPPCSPVFLHPAALRFLCSSRFYLIRRSI